MRSRKTPETSIAAQIRTAAAVYATNGQRERAEGMVQAADMVDELVKRDGVVLPTTKAREPSSLEARVARLEKLVGPRDIMANGPAAIAKKVISATLDKWAADDAARPPRVMSRSLYPMDARMLAVLAQRSATTTSGAQLAILTGYSRSGRFSGALARLRKAGWIAGDGRHISITSEGLERAPSNEPIPRGPELLEFWCEKVGTMGSVLLNAIVNAYPATWTAASLAETTGYSQSGSFSGALAVLRTLGLITKRGAIGASEELMQGIRS